MNIFSNFLNLIKKWFKPSKALPAPSTVTEETVTEEIAKDLANPEIIDTTETNETTTTEDRNIFVNNLKIKEQEESAELLDLQSKFESNQIQLTELTDEELDSLNDLYQRQIDALRQKINKTKTEININMNKLESTSVSA